MKENNILLICSPSIGILDNWLPVLYDLKKRRTNHSFVFVAPQSNSIDAIDEASLLFILAKDIFDRIIFRSWFGHWLSAVSFAEAKQINKRKYFAKIIYRISESFSSRGYKRIASLLINLYLIFKNYKNNYCKLQEELKQTDCVLYDIFEHHKSYNHELIKALVGVKKYSMPHGLDLRIQTKGISKIVNEDNNITAYFYSEHEREHYKTVYGLADPDLRIVGVARHSSSWMKFILEHEKGISGEIGEGFIFVISRPGLTKFLSRKAKRKSLEYIWRLGDELNKKIVVKLHPKEKRDGLCEEVFRKSHYGEKWFYSNSHPFILGQKSAFAISFQSGVSIDLIPLGVPTIELLDLRGIPEYDNKDALRDQNGSPVFSYRYYGLVLGANDYNDLKFQAERIINDRASILNQLHVQYNKFFAKIEKADVVVAVHIMAGLALRERSFTF